MNLAAKHQKELYKDINQGKAELVVAMDKQIRAENQALAKAGDTDAINQLIANKLRESKLTKNFTKEDVYFYLSENKKKIDAINKQNKDLNPVNPTTDPKVTESLLEKFNKLFSVKKICTIMICWCMKH